MKKMTLDTNILVSATFWTGDSFKIVDKINQKKIVCILSDEIISEYLKVVNSDEIIDKVANKSLIISKAAQNVISNSQIINPTVRLNVVKEDAADNKIIECAIAGKSDFIITNDNHLLKLKEYCGIKIVAPKEFLEAFNIE